MLLRIGASILNSFSNLGRLLSGGFMTEDSEDLFVTQDGQDFFITQDK